MYNNHKLILFIFLFYFHCRSAGKSNKILCLYKRLEKYKGDILRVFEKTIFVNRLLQMSFMILKIFVNISGCFESGKFM